MDDGWMLQSPKTNILADGLIKRTLSILDEITSRMVHKDAEGDDTGKRIKILSDVKSIEFAEFSRDTSCAKRSLSFI